MEWKLVEDIINGIYNNIVNLVNYTGDKNKKILKIIINKEVFRDKNRIY